MVTVSLRETLGKPHFAGLPPGIPAPNQSGKMSRTIQMALLVLAPLAVLLAVLAGNHVLGGPGEGYDYVIRFDLPPVDAPVDLPRVDGPADASRPLVVIDAGHGGFDPGAGKGALKEKVVALQVAKALRAQLLEDGGIRVALTRNTDRFIDLRDRPDIARRMGADLFVSIHADSAESDAARGASVYVLSEKGTGEAAERFAASAKDSARGTPERVNGIALGKAGDNVGSILFDLSQRNTQASSSELASLMLRELVEANVRLHRDHAETAALAVLKAPDIPSILFETGYINNPDDAVFLGSKQGQQVLAGAAARAIRVFFARKAGA